MQMAELFDERKGNYLQSNNCSCSWPFQVVFFFMVWSRTQRLGMSWTEPDPNPTQTWPEPDQYSTRIQPNSTQYIWFWMNNIFEKLIHVIIWTLKQILGTYLPHTQGQTLFFLTNFEADILRAPEQCFEISKKYNLENFTFWLMISFFYKMFDIHWKHCFTVTKHKMHVLLISTCRLTSTAQNN